MDYRIVEGSENMKLEDIVRLLRMSYWAANRPVEVIEKAVRNSSCYGVYADGTERLVGFARVISDYATSYYLCDVIVDPEYRGNGIGKALVKHIVSAPEYSGARGLLVTRDAHDLYRKYGFEVVNDRIMSRNPGSVSGNP